MNDLIDSFVEVRLFEDDDFLKVKETLTRIGIASPRDKRLYQSCHILHKRGRYYLTHFKELFALDGKPTNFSEEDKGRRNTIASLLNDWELFEILDMNKVVEPRVSLNQIKILPFREKHDWELISKYSIGTR